MKLYRVMKMDADGKPLVGTRRNMLGVRPTDPTNTHPKRVFDVQAVNDTDLVSATEGLSTSPTTDGLLPGRNEAIFVIETEDLPPELGRYEDNPTHHLIVPATGSVSLGLFQDALADTIDLWEPFDQGSMP